MKKYIIPIKQDNLDLVVVNWLIPDGASVEKGMLLVELECEKADLSLSAPVSGVLRHLRKVSERVIAGDPIGEIESLENYIADPENLVVQRETISLPYREIGFWTFSDGWVLAAISIGSPTDETNEGTNLPGIIKYGDFLNHAILTQEELTSSLTKLLQYDVINQIGENYKLSEAWREEIHLNIGDITPLGPITRIQKWLNNATFEKTNSGILEVTTEALTMAYDEYIAEIGSK